MDYRFLVYKEQPGVGYIALNNLQQKNSLSDEMSAELVALLTELNQRADIRVILLTAVGDAFSAGGDLKSFKTYAELSPPEHYLLLRQSLELFRCVNALHKPLIIGVNGAAFGGGVGLVATGHLAIASERAVFGLTEITLGLAPFIIYPFIKEAVGAKKALEMMLTAEKFKADKALEFGLVNKVVPSEQLEAELWQYGEQFSRLSPLTLDLALEIHKVNRGFDIDRMVEMMGVYRIISFTSEDLKEGISAFLQKRPADFQGR